MNLCSIYKCKCVSLVAGDSRGQMARMIKWPTSIEEQKKCVENRRGKKRRKFDNDEEEEAVAVVVLGTLQDAVFRYPCQPHRIFTETHEHTKIGLFRNKRLLLLCERSEPQDFNIVYKFSCLFTKIQLFVFQGET